MLPFKGLAHYDDVIDAWVGLHGYSVSNCASGYLSICPVVSHNLQPEWKIGNEMLFLKHPNWRHVNAKLVRMRERNEYCLVERILPEGEEKNHMLTMKKSLLHLTTFVVKYDETGELNMMVHHPSRFYKASSYNCSKNYEAFWI
jgi:hypothetical protein